MSFYSGYSFFIYLAMALVPAVVIGILGRSLKLYRTILTLFFVWMVYKDTPIQLIYLSIYTIFSVYLVKIYLYMRNRFGRNKYIYGHAVLFALLPLVISKVFGLYGKNVFAFLGISYICFRVIQILIETYDGVIREIEIGCFLNFILFFPCISSGPIDRSRRFAENYERIYTKNEYKELLGNGLYKIVLGLFYKVVCSAIFYRLLSDVFAERFKPAYIVGYAYIYGFYMFFDFAGYSSMAVGSSYLLGIKTPENFNKPFLSIDLKDFWNRWHITLSSWFRDFIFTRFMVDSVRKKRFKKRLNGAAVGLVLNMTIMGIWHGLELHYIIYGIYHGLLLAATEIYQKKSKFYSKYKGNKCYQAISWFITLNAVMFGFLIFSGHIQEIWKAAVINM